jgi:hypothetical protein
MGYPGGGDYYDGKGDPYYICESCNIMDKIKRVEKIRVKDVYHDGLGSFYVVVNYPKQWFWDYSNIQPINPAKYTDMHKERIRLKLYKKNGNTKGFYIGYSKHTKTLYIS